MNTNTLDKLRKLKFFGMFHAFKSSLETGKTNDYTADEPLGYLIDAEWDDRQNRRIERQILYAKFRCKLQLKMCIITLNEASTGTRLCAWRTVRSLIAMRTYSLPEVPALVKLCGLGNWVPGLHTGLPGIICQYTQAIC
jgi:hypothetical protein